MSNNSIISYGDAFGDRCQKISTVVYSNGDTAVLWVNAETTVFSTAS